MPGIIAVVLALLPITAVSLFLAWRARQGNRLVSCGQCGRRLYRRDSRTVYMSPSLPRIHVCPRCYNKWFEEE